MPKGYPVLHEKIHTIETCVQEEKKHTSMGMIDRLMRTTAGASETVCAHRHTHY